MILPIIFSAPMVRALLEGRKTMTRRLLYSERTAKNGTIPTGVFLKPPYHPPMTSGPDTYYTLSGWQRIVAGDQLWVRESLTRSGGYIQYAADSKTTAELWPVNWKQDPRPSIHMSRSYSRLTLNIQATKIERVQKISLKDAIAEGVTGTVNDWIAPRVRAVPEAYAIDCFGDLWRSLHGFQSWDDNPWVVALTFTVHKHNIDG